MDIKFYTIDCTACNVLERKLNAKNLTYETIRDSDAIRKVAVQHAITSAPILEVDGVVMSYADAVSWVNKQ